MDLPNRDRVERRFGADVATALGVGYAALRRFMREQSITPDNATLLATIPPDVMDSIAKPVQGALQVHLTEVFEMAADNLQSNQATIASDDDLSEWALAFAIAHAADVTERMMRTTQGRLQRLAASATVLDRNQLDAQISRLFRPNRAELVAITETTYAVSAAEQRIVRELRNNGVRLVEKWHTVRDRRVCPVCAPLDGRLIGDGWEDYPPAHSRCRCFITFENVEVNDG